MKITLYGAAGDVTGSAYHVQTSQASVLVDFGAFQGKSEHDNVVPPKLKVEKLDAVVLTHGHLDHVGRLPLLARRGYRGPIYATPATMDFVALILRDSLKVMTQDIERINRKRQRAGEELLKPPFESDDVERVIALLRTMPYRQSVDVAPGISVRGTEAGHMLGSVSIEMTAEGKRVVFSGDIGPRGMPMLRDPEPFTQADLVFLESTYGDRDHKSLSSTVEEFYRIVREALPRKGKILVPAFAVGRTQQMLYHLSVAFGAKSLPEFPVYVDSPMAAAANAIYLNHLELMDDEVRELVRQGKLRSDHPAIHVSETSEDSKALNTLPGPALIIAGAGMCNAGRILHHLKNNLWKPEAAVIIVGYQGTGSLGRQLIDGAQHVSIFGEKIVVNAKIHTLGGFSAHAAQTELLNWVGAMAGSRPRVILTHGEERGRKPLARLIQSRFGIQPELPFMGDAIDL